MEVIDRIMEALSDGSWHDLNELSAKKGLANVSITNLMLTLDFLAEYDFVELRETWKGEPLRSVTEAKLQPSVQRFWEKIIAVERTERK